MGADKRQATDNPLLVLRTISWSCKRQPGIAKRKNHGDKGVPPRKIVVSANRGDIVSGKRRCTGGLSRENYLFVEQFSQEMGEGKWLGCLPWLQNMNYKGKEP